MEEVFCGKGCQHPTFGFVCLPSRFSFLNCFWKKKFCKINSSFLHLLNMFMHRVELCTMPLFCGWLAPCTLHNPWYLFSAPLQNCKQFALYANYFIYFVHIILLIYLSTPKVRIFLCTIHILSHFKLPIVIAANRLGLLGVLQ